MIANVEHAGRARVIAPAPAAAAPDAAPTVLPGETVKRITRHAGFKRVALV